MKQVHSFDVFDTCLSRSFAAPSDLFLELAHQLLLLQPELRERFDAETLWAARMEAEKTARANCASEEVTLDEIWQALAERLQVPDLADLSSVELELEGKSLRPIDACLRHIAQLRAKGTRILFISDIYLPRVFVESQLRKHGFARAGDGIYVSSEVGKTKASGNLFRHVLEKENVTPAELRHSGDDAQSDVAAAARLGMKARLVSYRRITPEQSKLLQIEGPGYSTRSQLVGAMQTEALHESGTPAPAMAGLLGPFLLTFASWVLAQAKRDGVRRLYFLARDCQMASQVAGEIAGQFGGIECRYLHVSRQALLLPTACDLSEAGMPWMRRAYETPTLDRLLAKLELTYNDVSDTWKSRAGNAAGSYQLRGAKDWSLFWESLNREPLRSELLARVAERREAAQDYLRAQGLADGTSWAVVDLGWYLSCQSALRDILGKFAPSVNCRGYYLGLRRERLGPNEAGEARALFYQRGPDAIKGARKQPLFRHATLFEHLLGMADHPSVHHYEAGKPVFQSSLETRGIAAAQALHEAVRAFARQNAGLASELGEAHNATAILSSLIRSVAETPSATMAQAMATLRVSEDQNNLHAHSIATPVGAGEVAGMFLPRRARQACGLARAPSIWMEGRLAATSAPVRQLVALRRALGDWKKLFAT